MDLEMDKGTVTVVLGSLIAGGIGYMSGGLETAGAYLAGAFVVLISSVWLYTWVDDYATGSGP